MSLVVLAVYAVVIFSATTIGAVAGLGGGVIIKPVLDLLGVHDATTVNVYSSVAVFVMCCASLVKQLRVGFEIHLPTVLPIALGSLVGGLVGERVFSVLTATLDDHLVKAVQAGLLALVLTLILVFTLLQDRVTCLRIAHIPTIFAAGLGLGALAVFLGIGGGPLNVCALTFLFSMGAKEGAVSSLAIIFFSQLAKLTLATLSGTLASVEMAYMPVVVIAGLVGGLVGAHFNHTLSEEGVRRVYVCAMVALPLVSLYNCVHNLMAL